MSPLETLAHRLFWWDTPARDLSDLPRLLAQVMVYGTVEDLAEAQRHFPREAFRAVLATPPLPKRHLAEI